MKIKLFYVGVFFLALSVGCSLAIPFLSKPVIQDAVNIARTAGFPDLRAKANENLEVFDVGHEFFQEWPDTYAEMLEPGNEWALDGIKSRSGDKLLGLFYENHESFLRYSEVKIVKNKKSRGVTDEWNISAGGGGRPRFLIRNPGFLRPGKVETIFSGYSSFDDETSDYGYEMSTIRRDTVKELYLGDTKYSFSIRKGLDRNGGKIIALILGNGEIDQVIYYSDQPDIADDYLEGLTNNLLWAGDLDHDNKLDFYMEFFSEKGGYGTWLFLSSRAEKGKLVKIIGGFMTTGC